VDAPNIVTNVGVIDKAVLLLSVLAEGSSDLAELIRVTGFSRPTTHRLLQSLETHGLVRRDQGGLYALGLRLRIFGERASEHYPLAEIARPELVKLQTQTGEGAQLYIESGAKRLCLVAVESTHNLREIVPEGTLLPLELGSAGRVLCGDVPAAGFVATVEERAIGVASVSAPIYSPTRQVIAALSVSGPVSRMTRRPGQLFGKAVLRSVRRIEKTLA